MATLSKRHQIVKEILSTEQSYVSQLGLVTEVIIPAITPSLSHTQISAVFNNIASIHTTNVTLLAELTTAISTYDEAKTLVGPTLLRFIPFMRTYKQYAANYDNSRETWLGLLKKNSFAAKVTELFTNPERRLHGNDLFYYLIMPIQRIPRYVLLLTELIKETPKGHPDLKSLTEALADFKTLATTINTQINSSQAMQRLLEMSNSLGLNSKLMYQTYRTFVKQDVFYKHIPRADSGSKTTQQLPTTPQISRPNTESSPTATAKEETPSNNTNKGKKTKESKGAKPAELTRSQIKEQKKYDEYCREAREKMIVRREMAMADPVVSYHFFLFNDLLLYASDLGKGKFKTHQVIAITPDLEVIDPDPSLPSFWIVAKHFQFQLKLSIPDQTKKKDWVDAIRLYINQSIHNQFPTNNVDIEFSHQIDIPTQEGTTCSNCNVNFSIATHRHSCKFCCQLICDACGPNYVKIKGEEKEKGLRICKQCEAVRDHHGISAQPVKRSEFGEDGQKDEQLLSSSSATTQGSPAHRQRLQDYAKLTGLPPRYFVIPNRYHITTFSAQRVGQNGSYYPVNMMIFNDLIIIGQGFGGSSTATTTTTTNNTAPTTFTLHQIIPIDQLLQIQWHTSKEESKNKDKVFQKQVDDEESKWKKDEKSIFNTQFPFYLKRERLLLKLYFPDVKIRTQCGGVISGLVSQAKTRVPCLTNGCSNYDLMYYNQVPVEQSTGNCTLCNKGFGFFRGAVTCNFCQNNVCKGCSNSTAPAFPVETCTINTRCCDSCKLDRGNIIPKYSWFF